MFYSVDKKGKKIISSYSPFESKGGDEISNKKKLKDYKLLLDVITAVIIIYHKREKLKHK
ncbi:MAG: hypothetical protein Q4D95_01290 [Peptoniphilus sp.]|nr:hypothetical protein [Peptoniphilus sp.]